MMAVQLVVLISGNGSNLQAILDACATGGLPASVVAVISNKSSAYGLTRAQNAGVPAIHFPKRPNESRQDYDFRLAAYASTFLPDYIGTHAIQRAYESWQPGELLEDFEARVQAVEHHLLVSTLKSHLENHQS